MINRDPNPTPDGQETFELACLVVLALVAAVIVLAIVLMVITGR